MDNIKIYSARYDDDPLYNEDNRLAGTYAHGELETQLGYDIFSFEHKPTYEEGIHKMKVFNRPATLFLWKNRQYHPFHEWGGYLIYDTDHDYDWAKQEYEKKIPTE